jgi:hypothetical protein
MGLGKAGKAASIAVTHEDLPTFPVITTLSAETYTKDLWVCEGNPNMPLPEDNHLTSCCIALFPVVFLPEDPGKIRKKLRIQTSKLTEERICS